MVVSPHTLRVRLCNIAKSLRMKNNLHHLKTKSKNILHLEFQKPQFNYQIPAMNFSAFKIDITCLKYVLHHSFIDKKRFIKHV